MYPVRDQKWSEENCFILGHVYLFNTIFEGFLEKEFISIEKNNLSCI